MVIEPIHPSGAHERGEQNLLIDEFTPFSLAVLGEDQSFV